MTKVFVLVISMWGLTAEQVWVYTGNQLVLKEKFYELEKCESFGRKFMKFDFNKFYTMKVQCVEDIDKQI
tara:strand:- start:356 stop:565 length:210 start_codon:yes stop_codon:yes gene_type:complete